jgi:hypothetical protein
VWAAVWAAGPLGVPLLSLTVLSTVLVWFSLSTVLVWFSSAEGRMTGMAVEAMKKGSSLREVPEA